MKKEQLFSLLDARGFKYSLVDIDGSVIKVWSESPTLLVSDTSTKVAIFEDSYGVEWNEALLGVDNASSVLSILSAYFEENETLIPIA
jgi:hypothetical protein